MSEIGFQFNNRCSCIVDLELLSDAMIWLAGGKTYGSKRSIFIRSSYPAVCLLGTKYFVHHLIYMYTMLEKRVPSGVGKHTHVYHHRDGNRLNASVGNIEKQSCGDHTSLHLTGIPCPLEVREKISKSLTGRHLSKEHRIKISDALNGGKRKPLTEEHKRKISLSRKGQAISEETKRKMSESHLKRRDKDV